MKTKLVRLATFVGGAAGVGALVGCSSHAIDEARTNTDQYTSEGESLIEKFGQVSKDKVQATEANEYYIVGKKFKTESRQVLPAFFRQTYSFNRMDPFSLNELISYVSKETNVRIDLTNDAISYINGMGAPSSDDESLDVDQEIAPELTNNISDQIKNANAGLIGSDVEFTVNFKGTLKDFLDYITGRVNLYWEWKNNQIEIFHTKEQTFIIDADPSSVSFSAGVSSSASSSGSGGEESSVGGGSTSSHSTQISSQLGSIFDDLNSTIESLLSSDGSFSISKQLSTVTVTDTPANLERIERYIDQINKSVGKQLLINMRVIEVTSDEGGDYGVNWNAIFNNSSKVAASITPNFVDAAGSVFSVTSLNDGWGNGSVSTGALASAISNSSNASIVSDNTFHTTNGRPVPLQIADQEDYIKQTTSEVSDSSTSISVEVGSILSGTTLNVMPKITSQGKVSLMMAIDMTKSSIGDEKTFGGEDNQQIIQLPKRSIKNFVQRSIANNGEPIMLTGFERFENEDSKSSFSDSTPWILGGTKVGSKKKVMTVILITPYIMKD